MSKKSQKRQRLPRKVLVGVLVAVLLVLAVAAGVIVQLLQRGSQPTNKPKSNFTTVDSGLPQAVDKAQQQSANGDNVDAQNTINDALKTASNDEKKQLYIQQGVIYENQQQYDLAIASYKQAEQLGITFTIALRIAESSEAKGDKATAIAYYKKAIANIDQKSPLRDADKRNLEEKIRSLGGQP